MINHLCVKLRIGLISVALRRFHRREHGKVWYSVDVLRPFSFSQEGQKTFRSLDFAFDCALNGIPTSRFLGR